VNTDLNISTRDCWMTTWDMTLALYHTNLLIQANMKNINMKKSKQLITGTKVMIQ